MSTRLDTLQEALKATFGDAVRAMTLDRGEITLTVGSADYARVAQQLRDDPALCFEQLIDLCGVDYSGYRNAPWEGRASWLHHCRRFPGNLLHRRADSQGCGCTYGN